MQNNIETKNDTVPPVSPPLPPPPPPPPPSLYKLNSKNAEIVVSTPTTSELLNNGHFQEISRNIHHLFEDIHTNIVSFLKPLVPIIQEGPCCGIVALSMAGQFFNKNLAADKILSIARNSKFTNNGEMFSAYNMAKLSTALIDCCEAVVVSNLFEHKNDILKNLANGWPILIPYDADKNHEPCLNIGRNAHWAVLCGLCFSVSEDAYSLLDGYSATDEIPCVYNLSCSFLSLKLLNFATKICIYAYQGKSKHLALWDFDSLLLSNNNLYEVTNKYSIEDMVIPSAGLLELNDKAIILKQKS